jgi:pimeloyl-ACP methyl ester carboxylesterase
VTYDRRGNSRSLMDGPDERQRIEVHADDAHRLLTAVGGGPAYVFGNSSGAIVGLELAARHPEQVRVLVAHEPPLSSLLADRDVVLAVCRDIRETYLRDGLGPAMAKFIALVMHEGPLPADYLARPAPDPATFGLPTEDDGRRDDPLVGQNIVTGNAWEPDFTALRDASTRIVIGVGAASGETLAARAARLAADRLGTEPDVFPGSHDGFLGGEYGQTGEPDAFAARLREVLATT